MAEELALVLQIELSAPVPGCNAIRTLRGASSLRAEDSLTVPGLWLRSESAILFTGFRILDRNLIFRPMN